MPLFVSSLLLSHLAVPRAPIQQCAVDPGDLAALDQQSQADGRHSALQAELAMLVEEEGHRRLRCPLLAIASPPALPRDRWNQHDLSMLAGCWSRASNMTVHDIATDHQLPVASWRICFDGQGSGNQTLTLQNGAQCTGPVQATFEGDKLITRAARCTGSSFNFVRSEQDCTRVSDIEANCVGRNLEGPGLGQSASESRFRR